jgi:hypothetical protein
MINYFPIQVSNLNIIKEKILRLIPNYTTPYQSKFFYVPKEEILGIEELTLELTTIGLLNYIDATGINFYYKGIPVIHKDTGNFKYSLNIPIAGYNNTYINYYESSADPELKSKGIVSWLEYNASTCTLIEKFETNTPAIVNTQAPHAFENFNNEPRIMLLLRLDKTIDTSIKKILSVH